MHKLLRTDGSAADVRPGITIDEICTMIKAECLDTVPLRHMGTDPLHVMLVDDVGLTTGKPFNAQATMLYRMNRAPGFTGRIHGDAVVIEDYKDDGDQGTTDESGTREATR